MSQAKVYADYAAASPTDQRVVEAMEPFFSQAFGNPSSLHSIGRQASAAIDLAKKDLAKFLNCLTSEIIFTSSGTESNNLAILGLAKANKNQGNHLITTNIEHPSVLNAFRSLAKEGWQVSYLPVNQQGLIEPAQLEKAITTKTVLVSIHLANSEIGVIQDIPALAKIARTKDIYFHTDACQAAAYLDLAVTKLDVDLLSFNGSKIYGPKGVAALYVKQNLPIFPIFYGGGQQESLRSGTENVPGIVGLARAVKIITQQRAADFQQVKQLRDQLQTNLNDQPGLRVNLADSERLPNHLSLTFTGLIDQSLVALFDREGICLSSGSACSAKSLVDSHVLAALGLSSNEIQATVRLSLGRSSSKDQLNRIVQAAQKISLRQN